VAWYASTSKDVQLVLIPLRMALTEREREGHPVVAGQLIHHSDYAGVCVKPRIGESCCAGWGG
jgi:hypothetical protein